MILRDTVDVACAPERLFEFFEDMEAHYLPWQPDHGLFRWTAGRGQAVGSAFYLEEVIAGRRLKKKVMFTRIDRPSHIEFAPPFWLTRLFPPHPAFRSDETGADEAGPDETGPTVCRVVAEIHLRMGPLAARLKRRELNAVREHLRLEGVNLKRLIENHARPDHAKHVQPGS